MQNWFWLLFGWNLFFGAVTGAMNGLQFRFWVDLLPLEGMANSANGTKGVVTVCTSVGMEISTLRGTTS